MTTTSNRINRIREIRNEISDVEVALNSYLILFSLATGMLIADLLVLFTGGKLPLYLFLLPLILGFGALFARAYLLRKLRNFEKELELL